jgi:hypothetical protein
MKKNKSSAVMEMLKKGLSVKQIKERIAVSESYIYLAKKKLAEVAEEAVNETLHNITQGRQKYRGTAERRVAGGPATVVRNTTLSVDNTVYPNRDEAIIEAAEALKEACTFTPNKEQVDTVLDKRGTNYGTFLGLSQVTQRLKTVAHNFAGQNNKTFDADQAEALDMIFTKIGRILNGDANHTDSWIDIAGYATLVADRLQGKIR